LSLKSVLAVSAAIVGIAAIVAGMVILSTEAFAVPRGTCGRLCGEGRGSQASSHISAQGLAHMSSKGKQHSRICSVCE
jgi:hypothetical protein